MVGLKSTALKFGDRSWAWVLGFYASAVVLWAAAALLSDVERAFYVTLAAAAIQLAWQALTLDASNPANCLVRFRSNRYVGWLLFGGLIASMML